MTYRKSAVDKAGFKEFPKDFPGFLEMCKALKKNNTPAGFALGHATGDANGWLHWILWGHGAYTVDKDDKVIINSPETVKALEYCKALSDTFIPGVASWNDGSNNKAYLAGELYCTANGISIYVAAKDDPTKKELAEDTYHALWPVGPIGKPTELQLAVPILAFNFTKYPNAAKAFIAFMLEKENYDKWLSGARGYLTHTLNAYDTSPVWTADPKNQVFSQASKRALPASGIGTPGEKAATAIADFLVVDMFANYCTGREDAKGAIAVSRTAVEAHLSLRRQRGGRRAIAARLVPIMRYGSSAAHDIAGFRPWLTSHSQPRAAKAADPRGHRVGSAQDQPQLARLLVHAAGDGVPDLLPGLSARARHLDFVHRRQDRPAGRVHRHRELRVAVGRRDLLALGLQYAALHLRRQRHQIRDGLYLALLLNENMPFKAMLRALVLIPFIVPTVLSALAFWWIFDSQFSIISWSLKQIGLIIPTSIFSATSPGRGSA